jgi:hypothetical protein
MPRAAARLRAVALARARVMADSTVPERSRSMRAPRVVSQNRARRLSCGSAVRRMAPGR